ncbi:MAG: hypothetical protein R3B95_11535 [Nitrospirales bacterium]|nr:hypothetical protein [Nitrospirales bacterium]
MSLLIPSSLTTLEKVKMYIPNLSEPSQEDQQLRGMISAVSMRFDNHTHRKLKSRTYKPSGANTTNGEENLKLNGTKRLSSTRYMLPHCPVTNIASCVIRDRNMTVVKTLDIATDTVFDPDTGIVELIDGDVWELGVQNIEMTWTAGFTPVPNDLEMACIMQTLNDYFVVNRNRLGITAITVEGETTSVENKTLLNRVKGILENYVLPYSG